VILTARRLRLREFTESDWVDLHDVKSDPEVARYQSFELRTADERKAYVERTIASVRETPRRTYDLAVLLTAVRNGLLGAAACRSRTQRCEKQSAGTRSIVLCGAMDTSLKRCVRDLTMDSENCRFNSPAAPTGTRRKRCR